MDINNYEDFADDIANYEFQKLFYTKHESSKIEFYSDTFQNCLRDVTVQKKPLILILHNDDEQFSKDVFELITEKDIEESINEDFILMGWNINSEKVKVSDALVNKVLIVGKIKDNINNNKPGIFFIIPNNSSVKVETIIENKIDKNVFRSALKEIQKFVSMYIKHDYFKNMTSIKYQQFMYEQLSDRDYDSFERNEDKLLKDKILYAMYGPPRAETGYEEKEHTAINEIYEKIRETNNKYSEWNDRIVIRFIYNCTEPLEEEKKKKAKAAAEEKIKRAQELNEDYNDIPDYIPEQDFVPVPVFVLRKCKGSENPCRIFIDNTRRVYEKWENYLNNNVLPPCKMIFPINGKYQSNSESNSESNDVLLNEQYSPNCSAVKKALQFTDTGSGVVSLLSGIGLVASMLTPAALVIAPAAIIGGAVSGTYAVGRSVGTLVDREKHQQTINITNSESRAAYLNIAAGTFSFVGAGATQLVSKFARTGANIGTGTQYAVNAINGFNIVVSGTATVNSGYEVFHQCYENKEAPSPLTIMQLGASLFFFGNSVLNFRTAGSIIHEAQTSTISELNNALRSNRHRKTFNKLLKETTRTRGGASGRAEVIATMRNAASRDDILAVLTRSNKNFNKQGIRFSAADGGIQLNGVSVEILEFGNMQKTQQGVFLEDLPRIPDTFHSTNTVYTSNIIQNMKLNNGMLSFFQFPDASDIKEHPLTNFKQEVQKKIGLICEKFMNQLDIDFILDLKRLLSGDTIPQILQFIIKFIRNEANVIKDIFENRLLNEDVKTVCKHFGFKNPAADFSNFLDYVIEKLLEDKGMETLTDKFKSWYTTLVYEEGIQRERKEKRDVDPQKLRKDCSVCSGYYYIVK